MFEQIFVIRPRLLAHASFDGEIAPQPSAQKVDAGLFGLSSRIGLPVIIPILPSNGFSTITPWYPFSGIQ